MNLNSNSRSFSFDIKSFLSKAGLYWKRVHTFVFLLCIVMAIVIGIIIWRQALNGAGWSEQKKQEYLNANNKIVNFKEKDFNDVIADVNLRKNVSIDNGQARNIFAPY